MTSGIATSPHGSPPTASVATPSPPLRRNRTPTTLRPVGTARLDVATWWSPKQL